MSFGAGKNPPWAREVQAGLTQQQVNVAQSVMNQPGVATPTVYSLGNAQPTLAQHQYTQQLVSLQQSQLAAQQVAAAAAVLPQPGIAIPTTLATTQVATVSYPTPRAAQQGGSQPKQRVFTGTVTKLHDNFGFVDEDVFFQISCVKGPAPNVGDRVLVEASYNANMPFKWNATRIQVLPNQQAPMQQQQSGPTGYVQQQPQGGPGLLKPPVQVNMGQGGMPPMIPSNMSQPPPLMAQPTQPTGGLLPPPRRETQRLERAERVGGSFRDRESRDNRERDRDRTRHERRERRSPVATSRKRSRSPRRSRSPSRGNRSPQRSRRPTRIVPRYMVQVPKLSLDNKDANVISLRSRYTNLYIPSDFFNTTFAWVDAFPLHRPFQLGNQSSFHVMHKEVDSLEENNATLEPTDADHLYSAKVMLLACPSLDELYKKSCALAEDPSEMRDAFQHPTRLVQFLVGLKGKSEPMAIGGPWSPSLDGKNPDDPRVLINTAIRTTRALTGIDLSKCTQWYRFAEIRYHRPEETHKGRLVPARVETTILFLPDVWNCNPTRLDWDVMQSEYRKQLHSKVAEENQEDAQEEDEEGSGEAGSEKKDPTHYSELDPKTMKVVDLRKELECRNLSSKGLKSQLIARLTKASKSEQEKEQEENENKEEEEEKPEEEDSKMEVDDREEEKKKKEEEEKKRKEEREKAARERRYTLPENPAIVVHPSATAKNGKFDCTVMSLSVLLDYRPEDNKEHSFEVSLFAELFNEMLMRDFGFRIYKSLIAAPDRPKEDKKKKSDKDKSEEKDKKEEKKEEKDNEKEDDNSAKRRKTTSESEGSKKENVKKEDDEQSGSPEVTKEEEKDESREKKEESSSHKDKEKEKDKDKKRKEKERDKDREKEKDKEKDKKKEKVKYVSLEKDLLLAFCYFDQSHTGYVLDRDMEEIIHTLGLQLSRAQVKKLVQKLISRDTLNYRKLTDKPEEEKKKLEIAAENKEKEKDKDEEMKEEQEKEEASNNVEELARGNRDYIPRQLSDLSPKSPKRKKEDGKGDNKSDSKPDSKRDASQNMVLYKGAMVDVNSIMQRLEKSEASRKTLELKHKDLQEEMDEVKDSFSSSEKTGKKVALELQELKKKLRDQRRATDKSEDLSKRYKDCLMRIQTSMMDNVSDVTHAIGVKREKEDSDVKSESAATNGE